MTHYDTRKEAEEACRGEGEILKLREKRCESGKD